jgi:pimeloyl-ACP methyl ester carboxylesterase
VGPDGVPEDAWTELGGDGPRLVFTHANGFPPGAYRILLERLSAEFSVAAFANRALWSKDDPDSVASWDPLADDLRRGLAARGGTPVVGVGHSIGGVLVALAAARSPELFSRLVLLDPVVFTGVHALIWGWMKRIGVSGRFPLAAGAHRRRDTWPDRDAVRSSWSGKPVFATWDPRVFEDYLEGGVVDRPDGSVALRYPREWEARLFQVCPHDEWAQIRRVEAPVLVVRGASSDTLSAGAARRIERDMPNARVVELAGASHFLPMEMPDAVAGLIVDFAAERGIRYSGCR